MRMVRSIALLGAGLALFAACRQTDSTAPSRYLAVSGPSRSLSDASTAYSPVLALANSALAAHGVTNVQLLKADIFVSTNVPGWNGATTIYANDRTHVTGAQFVLGDWRRGGQPYLTYLVDQSDGRALTIDPLTGAISIISNAVTEAEIDASMARWQTEPGCSAPPVQKVSDTGADPDIIDGLLFHDNSRVGTTLADITDAGWLPASFFEALVPGGSQFILGVTFSFVFVTGPEAGAPATDIDHNGRADIAFSEIYYNRSFPWTADASNPTSVDIQSVVTHESGHALGLDHFGKIFLDNKGVLKFAPRAVMNAAYVSAFRDLTGTDNASFCQLWARVK
jgi:matrixin